MNPTVKLISKCYVLDIDDLQLVINITKISRKKIEMNTTIWLLKWNSFCQRHRWSRLKNHHWNMKIEKKSKMSSSEYYIFDILFNDLFTSKSQHNVSRQTPVNTSWTTHLLFCLRLRQNYNHMELWYKGNLSPVITKIEFFSISLSTVHHTLYIPIR